MIALFFAIFTATFRLAQPTVGDLITIDFAQPVTLDRSEAFEIVSQKGSRVVIRTFTPRQIALSGVAGGVRFRNLVVPVRSVLKPKDDMKPAALVPPRVPESPRVATLAMSIAGALAVIGWLIAFFASRRKERAAAIVLPPAERFRIAVRNAATSPQRWASLADATRTYLASRGFGADLTTSQILARVHGDELIAEILHRGDLEKFSPWGAPSGDFDATADRALSLIERFEPPPIMEKAA